MDTETLVIVTALGTLLTAVFTGYALLQHALDRPKPRWVLTRSTFANPSEEHGTWLFVEAVNLGDGVAYDARLAVIKGSPVPTAAISRMASVANGDKLVIAVRTGIAAPEESDRYGNALSVEVADPRGIGPVKVRLTWNHPPHRWWTRRKTRKVRQLSSE